MIKELIALACCDNPMERGISVNHAHLSYLRFKLHMTYTHRVDLWHTFTWNSKVTTYSPKKLVHKGVDVYV